MKRCLLPAENAKAMTVRFTCSDLYLTEAFIVITHIFMVCWNWAKRQGLSKVYVHCFLDGRDTPPASGKEYVTGLEAKMKEIGVGEEATVMTLLRDGS